MANTSTFKALLVADGSGGHLIPAFQAAGGLAGRGARVKVWYPHRRTTAPLADALREQMQQEGVDVEPFSVGAAPRPWTRLWGSAQLWQQALRCFETFAPDVVVGFGGWVSAPVIVAARHRRIPVVLHEQNVVLGRANRWLARYANQVAVSFAETQAQLGRVPSVVTGLPIRRPIGRTARAQAAARLGLHPEPLTLLVLGGSQGARPLNRLLTGLAALCSPEERQTWQVVHVTGASDDATVRRVYAAYGMRAWVGPFLAGMEDAYAVADVAIARAGASTIAELACCGVPAVLIPYPHAGGHQRMNAGAVETLGGGIVIEESEATPEGVLSAVRRLLTDERLRHMMGAQMRRLHAADAAERLADAILGAGRAHAPRAVPVVSPGDPKTRPTPLTAHAHKR